MNYQQVTQFLAIVKHMNLSKASEELYISQPALSLALGRLEKELDIQLFYRDGKKLIITPAGKKLYDYFIQLKESHDNLTNAAKEFLALEQTPQVTLGFSVSALFFSTLYMSGTFNKYKDIELRKIFADSTHVLSMLKNGMIDFAITCPPIVDNKVISKPVASEPYALVVSSEHPFAVRSSISVQELHRIKLTGLNKSQPARRHNDTMCAQNHVKPIYIKECDYPEYYSLIKKCAFSDNYAALIPAYFYEQNYPEGYKLLPFSDGNMVRQTTISWLAENNTDLERKELLDYIIDNYHKQQDYHVKYSKILFKMDE